ncbi:GCN5-related N-acetyltransferase 6, chloroplastic [Cornus florida]|uniref:GCN5-related N-acetyltransferase 6, chloroplastic n=1 Tax=Cornus florida TaxID=4283 RepID=UPI0028979514|nr:GCN5-related N-acetyltransferase 6, chloroplastic [Cornus florida]
MWMIPLQRPGCFLRTSCYGIRNHHKFRRIYSASWTMTLNSKSFLTSTKEELSIQPRKLSATPLETITTSNLRFDRLQPSDEEFIQENRFEFGNFVAREPLIDEEFWTAAWLRAETHWEDQNNDRYADNYKRQFAEQEFNALKRRSKVKLGQKCSCIVAVKKEETNVKRTVLKSVVGTLDLSIRCLLYGETFPGEMVKTHLFCCISRKDSNKYGYIANLCVAKSARRQGIARNMLHFAIESANSNGAEEVFVHVHRNNSPAQDLYQKIGFEVVDMASPQLQNERTYLLRFKT